MRPDGRIIVRGDLQVLAMDKKVVLISDKESFMMRAIQMNLEQEGYEVVLSMPDRASLEKKLKLADLYVFYPGPFVNMMHETMGMIWEECREGGKYIFVIGTDDELHRVDTEIPGRVIRGRYHRPLNIRRLVEDLDEVADPQPVMDTAERKKILLVDDDGTFLQMVKGSLDSKYSVDIVSSGMQAITYLATNTPDLVLLDYEMPVTSGAQVLRMMRSEPVTSRIPVIFLTGRNDKASIMEVMALKPQGYILKSLRLPQIVSYVDQYFIDAGRPVVKAVYEDEETEEPHHPAAEGTDGDAAAADSAETRS